MEDIELNLDETNEITFKITVEGTESKPSKIRFVCENESEADGNEFAYVFKAKSENGAINIKIPPMQGKLQENLDYVGKLEIFIEDRCFVPLKCNLKFKKPMKIVAESVSVKSHSGEPKSQIKASFVKQVATKKSEVHEKDIKNLASESTLGGIIKKIR
jgi:hypothetical protein